MKSNQYDLPKVCPRCGMPLKARHGKYGNYLDCTGYPDCKYTLELSDSKIRTSTEGISLSSNCPKCNKKLAIYIGKNGAFFGCNGYPHCKFSFNVDNLDNISCPKCGSLMTERTGKYGIFLGCRSYPDCKFTFPIRISKSLQQETEMESKPKKKIKYTELTKEQKYDYVYILKLENKKWWVGRTKNPAKGIARHKDRQGSSWTRNNKVLDTEEIIQNGNLTEITLDYMKKYGWQNVRGTCFNDAYYIYIPKKIKAYIKSQEGGLDFFTEKEKALGPKFVYTLKLEHGKWYVGRSINVERRVEQMKEKGNTWTQLHNILGVEEIFENGDLKQITIDYMRKYGWENVRGYAWSQWNMKYPPKELRKEISTKNYCAQCGSSRVKNAIYCMKCGKKLD